MVIHREISYTKVVEVFLGYVFWLERPQIPLCQSVYRKVKFSNERFRAVAASHAVTNLVSLAFAEDLQVCPSCFSVILASMKSQQKK